MWEFCGRVKLDLSLSQSHTTNHTDISQQLTPRLEIHLYGYSLRFNQVYKLKFLKNPCQRLTIDRSPTQTIQSHTTFTPTRASQTLELPKQSECMLQNLHPRKCNGSPE